MTQQKFSPNKQASLAIVALREAVGSSHVSAHLSIAIHDYVRAQFPKQLAKAVADATPLPEPEAGQKSISGNLKKVVSVKDERVRFPYEYHGVRRLLTAPDGYLVTDVGNLQYRVSWEYDGEVHESDEMYGDAIADFILAKEQEIHGDAAVNHFKRYMSEKGFI